MTDDPNLPLTSAELEELERLRARQRSAQAEALQAQAAARERQVAAAERERQRQAQLREELERLREWDRHGQARAVGRRGGRAKGCLTAILVCVVLLAVPTLIIWGIADEFSNPCFFRAFTPAHCTPAEENARPLGVILIVAGCSLGALIGVVAQLQKAAKKK